MRKFEFSLYSCGGGGEGAVERAVKLVQLCPEMAFSIKMLAANLQDPSSTSETHMMEADNQLLKLVLWPHPPPHTCSNKI